ncbi:hypothetical protein LOD99_6106 [Oopsacas minuta]|uniref:Integrase catalytic domain-containing protein n=1 Tax=Oopsacas minuta TaxID=111878 RepID=A0AAV7JN12_9METZ|nr:hypothetical protein LOD99_6106 [Oopsacas minuta]
MKADYELYYCKFSRTIYPDCSIKAKIEKYGTEYKVCLFGHHKHDECNQKVELLNKGLSYEKKQLCLEILKSNPYTLPRKIFDIMVNQRPDLTFVPDDIIKIRHFKQNNKSNIFSVHVEDSRQAMCDEVSKYQDHSQVFVRQKPEEIYNDKGELFLTIQHMNMLKNMSVLNKFINSDTTHRMSKSRLNTLACGIWSPNKDGWLRGKVGPGIPTDNNSQEKFFHTFKRTLMQTTHGDILYLKEAIKFISSQSKLESRSLPSHPLDLDCDPPKHVLSRIRGFFQRAFEKLASSESDGIFPAETSPLDDLQGLSLEESLAQLLAERIYLWKGYIIQKASIATC